MAFRAFRPYALKHQWNTCQNHFLSMPSSSAPRWGDMELGGCFAILSTGVLSRKEMGLRRLEGNCRAFSQVNEWMNEVQTCEEVNGRGSSHVTLARTWSTGVRFADEYLVPAFWRVFLQWTHGNKWWKPGHWLLFLFLLFCTVLVFIYRL